jgi:hypothetical protein
MQALVVDGAALSPWNSAERRMSTFTPENPQSSSLAESSKADRIRFDQTGGWPCRRWESYKLSV